MVTTHAFTVSMGMIKVANCKKKKCKYAPSCMTQFNKKNPLNFPVKEILTVCYACHMEKIFQL